ncbi:hypothetical protein [uncultured Jatrophihabitans sp.]|uniref:hypothetical protein n=1 Tax=uncultured Jatrophihabitans sp. TaxID=1610747 RepID=UPI0035CC367A
MTATTSKKNKPVLPQFEQQDVHGATVRITNAGDGLSEALKVEPKALHLGDEVFYVLAGDVSQINHVDKDGILTRVHTVKASQITAVDGELAGKLLAEAAEELQRKKDEVEGQQRLALEQEAEDRERADQGAAGAARTANGGNVKDVDFSGKRPQ